MTTTLSRHHRNLEPSVPQSQALARPTLPWGACWHNSVQLGSNNPLSSLSIILKLQTKDCKSDLYRPICITLKKKLNASEESRTEVLRKKRETMRSHCAVTCGLLLVSLTMITASVIHGPLHDEPLHRDARGGKYSAVSKRKTIMMRSKQLL